MGRCFHFSVAGSTAALVAGVASDQGSHPPRQGHDRDVQSALDILDALYEIAQRTFNVRFQIEILALAALALDMQGQTGDALAALQQAVELSRPGGFIRVFVDLGPRMQVMLLRLAGQGFAAETVRRILAAFPVPRKKIETGAAESRIRTASAGLVEPLTGRELEVLALLRERLSNKEIAHKLGLSPTTVKRHTANLYGKLDVNRRMGRSDQGRSPRNPSSSLTSLSSPGSIVLHLFYTLWWYRSSGIRSTLSSMKANAACEPFWV